MAEVFRVKLRKIGNSLGVIIPNRILKDQGYSKGDLIPLAVTPFDSKKRNKRIFALAGIDSGKPAFKREKRDRY